LEKQVLLDIGGELNRIISGYSHAKVEELPEFKQEMEDVLIVIFERLRSICTDITFIA
jgi:hypothetical protein